MAGAPVPALPRVAEGPNFADHSAVLDLLWAKLEGAVRDRRSPWHTPAVATVRSDGAPSARVMVLRGADREKRALRLHSDRRAAKAGELAIEPRTTLLFYDAPARLQVRASGIARFLTEGAEVDAAWFAARPFSRRCYMAPDAPGATASAPTSGLPPALERREPTLEESEAGRAHFGVMHVEVSALEWLSLAVTGHRRGWLRWVDGAWEGEWLVP